MKLANKNLLYSIILAGVVGIFIIGYLLLMLPSLYTDYKKELNYNDFKTSFKSFVESEGNSAEGIPTKSIGITIPLEGYKIEVSNNSMKSNVEINDKDLRDILDQLRDALKNNKDLGKNKSELKDYGKKFEKISMSGVSTTFELTGLTKGYTSAAPGRIIKTLAKFGCNDPLILLDEIDKINQRKSEGDIEGVLLEILDPDQNKRFRDEFLELEYDLSNVMFLATANDLSEVSEPLKSRMEIIYLEDYNLEQKVEIAKNYIVPSINKKIGSKLFFSDDILKYVIQNYTNEAGVRKLKTILMKVYGKIAKEWLEKKKKLKVTLENIDSFICADKIPNISLKLNTEESKIGKVLGMGVTLLGGKVMVIQTVVMPGNGKIIITGNLSEVMKEGINVAITYLRTKTEEYHLKNPNFYKENDIHVHFSENAIQKDGPSAGIAITTCILSALKKVELKQDTAFTGEITILGEVLPVGGVEKKIEGAYKSGIRKFFVPKANENCVNFIRKDIIDKIKIEFVENYEQIYSKLFLACEEEKNL